MSERASKQVKTLFTEGSVCVVSFGHFFGHFLTAVYHRARVYFNHFSVTYPGSFSQWHNFF